MATFIQAVATALETLDKDLLLSQSEQCAGFYADRSYAPSVTNALPLEIEKRKSCCLGERISAMLDHCKIWALGLRSMGKDEHNSLSLPSGPTGIHGGQSFSGVHCYIPQTTMSTDVTGCRMLLWQMWQATQLVWCNSSCSLHAWARTLQPTKQTSTDHPGYDEIGGNTLCCWGINFSVDKIGHPYITSYVNHVSSHPTAQKAPHAIALDIALGLLANLKQTREVKWSVPSQGNKS